MTDEIFEKWARTYSDTIFRVALHGVRDRGEAEDVTQTVLLRLYQHTGNFDGEEHLKHWLLRVTVNESRKVYAPPGRNGPYHWKIGMGRRRKERQMGFWMR